MIPDDLSRELCEALGRWDPRYYDFDDSQCVELFLAPVIAKYLAEAIDAERMAHEDAEHPWRKCCASRQGRQHTPGCIAITAALTDNPNIDIEGWGE